MRDYIFMRLRQLVDEQQRNFCATLNDIYRLAAGAEMWRAAI